MEILFNVVSALFIVYSCLSSVSMYYIYEDAPQAGFVEQQPSSLGNQPYNGIGKKSFARYNSFKYSKDRNGQVLDSQFKIKKMADKYYIPSVEILKLPELQAKVESSRMKVKEEIRPRNEEMRNIDFKAKDGKVIAQPKQKMNSQPQTQVQPATGQVFVYPRSNREEGDQSTNQRAYITIQGSQYEKNPNSVKVNVRRTPIQTAPQKVRLNNNRQLTAVSIPGPANHHHHKMLASNAVDKNLQKNTYYLDREADVMSRVLDDISTKMATGSKKSKRKVTSDALKKYIGKDDEIYPTTQTKKNRKAEKAERFESLNKYLQQRLFTQNYQSKFLTDKRKAIETVRIGSKRETLNVPYALFYRVNPDAFMDRDIGFIPFRSSVQSLDIGHVKEKMSPQAFKEHVRQGANTVKLHKNYRKF